MRLLKREKSGWFMSSYVFSLTNFGHPRDIPSEYAILSHRWGPDEVTYKDIESGTAKTKAGYKKLEFCGEQAARDGLLYFWVDTCCIDKTNSVELQEAINSMFKWYQNATKCYVYLPDVSTHHDSGNGSARDGWQLAFQNSKWFTRGWTLQELIAPTTVDFFSVEGQKLGDKQSLEREINRITKIPIEVLQGKPLSEIDEEERFSWAAKRQTTVDEDAVYCLLGIFDVHMPLIYSEGRQKALARLKKEIQQSSKSDPSVAADAPWIVPFEKNPLFTGRESQLAELEGKLFAKDHTTRVAITGLGGIGKTQLVLELLYRTKAKHKDCSIIWIPATTTESLQQGYLMVAQRLGIPGCEDQDADVRKLVQDRLSKNDTGPWLLVFDNADDINLWTETPTQVREDTDLMTPGSLGKTLRLIDYLPRNKRGCIIFTTRDRKAAVRLAQQNIMTVPEMGEDAATQLLKKSLANPDLVDNAGDVSVLLIALTYLPLAITQATAYINANEITLADYVSLLEEKEEAAIDVLSEDFEDFGRYQNLKNPVATTWLISFEQIQRSDLLAAEYLSFMACAHPRDIPESILPPGPSRKRELEAIGTLTAYSFISRRPAESSFDLHRLVYLATRNWLRKEGLLSQWSEKTIIRLEEVFPENDESHRNIWRTYLPHARQVLASDLVNAHGEQRRNLMQKCGMCFYHDGRWNDAEATFSELLAIDRKMLDEETVAIANITGWLATIYRKQGRWTEAEELEMQTMETLNTKLGPDHFDTLISMGNLASTYSQQGRWKEAEQLQLQMIEMFKTKLGPDHPDTLRSMSTLALTFWEQGQLKEAELLQVHVRESSETKLGADHPQTLTNIANLAMTYSYQGRWKEAEQLQVQVMEADKTRLGPDHPDTLTNVGNLAMTYSYQGRWKEAEQLQVQVIETCKTKLGTDHPQTLTSIANLAFTWKGLARNAQAMELLRDCVQRQSHILGATHPNTLATEKVLAVWEAEELVTGAEVATEEDQSERRQNWWDGIM